MQVLNTRWETKKTHAKLYACFLELGILIASLYGRSGQLQQHTPHCARVPLVKVLKSSTVDVRFELFRVLSRGIFVQVLFYEDA